MARDVVYKIYQHLFSNSFEKKIGKLIRRKFWGWKVRNECGSVGECLRVNYKSTVSPYTHLGNYVGFNGMQISGGGKVTIGDYFHSGEKCVMITDVHNYDYGEAIPYDQSFIRKDINIGDFVWLGDGVTILGGVTIGDGAIIQAYSTVVNDIPEGGIAGGHPAKVFKYRNMDHFNRLREEKKFY